MVLSSSQANSIKVASNLVGTDERHPTSLTSNALEDNQPQQLQQLANFVYKNYEMAEELFHCVMNELGSCTKAGQALVLLALIDEIVHQGRKYRRQRLIREVTRDISEMVGSFLAKFKDSAIDIVILKGILAGWRKKEIISTNDVRNLEKLYCKEMGPIEETLTGLSKAECVFNMDQDREKMKRRKEDIWRGQDDFELYYQEATLEPNNPFLTSLGQCLDDDQKYEKILIWDLDETCILYRSLLDGKFIDHLSLDLDDNSDKKIKLKKQGQEVGKFLERIIYDLCDDYFFYTELESFDQYHINHLKNKDDGKDLSRYRFEKDDFSYYYKKSKPSQYGKERAYRYREIKQMYLQPNLVEDFLSSIKESRRGYQSKLDLYSELTENWQVWIRKSLEFLIAAPETDSSRLLISSTPSQKKKHPPKGSSLRYRRNGSIDVKCVIVSSTPLVPTLAKLLVYQLDDLFRPEDVYSSAESGKQFVFDQIKERYGERTKNGFLVIGDGTEEEKLAKLMNWNFFKIDGINDVKDLYYDLVLNYSHP